MGPGPDVPDGVLVQSVRVDEEGVESGWRVWADGRHESRRDGAPWEEVGVLGPERVAALRAALDEAPLPEIAGVHRPAGRTFHAGALWFHAARSEGPATVVLVGGVRCEPLERLTGRMLPILA